MTSSIQSSRPSLYGLATELFCEVVASLPRLDLKSLRLINRTLCQVSSNQLFGSIDVRCVKSSVRQLGELSISSSWASQVQCISWTPPHSRHYTRTEFPDAYAEMAAVISHLGRLSSIKAVHFTEDAVVDWVLHFTEKHVLSPKSCDRGMT